MYRAFQTAMGIHNPDIVFVLGESHTKFGNLNHKMPGVFVLGSLFEKPVFSCLSCFPFIDKLLLLNYNIDYHHGYI